MHEYGIKLYLVFNSYLEFPLQKDWCFVEITYESFPHFVETNIQKLNIDQKIINNYGPHSVQMLNNSNILLSNKKDLDVLLTIVLDEQHHNKYSVGIKILDWQSIEIFYSQENKSRLFIDAVKEAKYQIFNYFIRHVKKNYFDKKHEMNLL
jgi:hypothetical protein